MSGAIGRVTTTLGMIQNKKAVSFVNLSADFTLIKVEAPPESKGVGPTISEDRKINAEDGTVHRTARKLGPLFEGSIPSMPEL